MTTDVVIRRDVLGAMLRHARSALPNEAVGLLASDATTIVRCYPLPNISPVPHVSFLADPYAQFKAMKDSAAAGLKMTASYHSHPDGGAGLSEEDLHFARGQTLHQLVIALPTTAGDPEVVAFRIVDGKPMAVAIVVG